MKLESFGYNKQFEQLRIENNLQQFEVGRVILEHKERYIVKTEFGDLEAEITGNLRFSAESREDFPAVGDWVALTIYDSEFAIIHKIFPRLTMISREAIGQFGEIQIIATNIDYALLIQATDNNFNINRLERYLTICHTSKVSPIIVLTKIDLISDDDLSNIIESINQRVKNVPIVAISNKTDVGFEKLNQFIEKEKTYCMLGSSGVGKSTLLNNLSGKNIMKTDEISKSTNKGKHVTTHRELTVLENGAILIDNPGMREVGIGDSSKGLEIVFDKIIELSKNCKFKNCTHKNELGCAIIEAIENDVIDKNSYQNYLKMEKEKQHFESTLLERRKKDKEFGKMVKGIKKDIKNRKQSW
ncbi:ribosome small subunit-dependent GTPase A [bacterium]|nr:ribosome small subunit-dependent GTPase A [bacterium]